MAFPQYNSLPDSLKNKSYDYLDGRIDTYKNVEGRQAVYLHAFLSKAKADGNIEEIVNGYKNYIPFTKGKLKLVYADSMVYAARASGDNVLIGSAYLTKGIAFYGLKRHKEALDYYLLANEHISKTSDEYLIHKVKYNIAQIKYYLGYYDEAIALLTQSLHYFEQQDPRGYLNTLHSLGVCYNKIGNYGLCTQTNELGIEKGVALGISDMHPYFLHSEGINQYFLKNYASSLHKIRQALPEIIKKEDFANETVGFFYIGKSYLGLGKMEAAMPYFRKVDKSFDEKNYIRPDLRENYEILIRHFEAEGNLQRQLYYVKKLLTIDSILHHRYEYLSSKIHKEYDTRELLQEKENIELSLRRRKYNDFILGSVIVILFIVVFMLCLRHIQNKKIFRRKFAELMEKKDVREEPREPKKIQSEGLEISSDTVAHLLKLLDKFERDKRYLDKDWSLVRLAAAFNSNTTYLSQIIYHHRGKKFVEYINALKVEYILHLLKTDKRYRNYTNKTLAEEAGFTSTQRFATAFLAHAGMPTSFFIEELKKQ